MTTSSRCNNLAASTTSVDRSQLNILFWNARSVHNKKEEIQKIALEFDIIVVVETWLNDIKPFSFDLTSFNVYKCNRTSSAGGGIAILIRNTLNYVAIDDLANTCTFVELCGVRITNTTKPLALLACYKPPNHRNLTAQEWETIMSNTSTSDHYVLMGDFNSHNVTWNCTHTDPDGEKLSEAADENNLFLHNPDVFTHIDASTSRKSNLDLVFSTMSIAPYITTKVLPDTMGSDHFPVNITVDITKTIYSKQTFKIQSKRTRWTEVHDTLEKAYTGFLSFDYEILSPQQKYKFFTDLVTNAVLSATPKKRTVPLNKHRNPAEWWDMDCDRAKRLRQAAFKKWEYTKTEEDRLEYKKLRAEARKIFRRKKRECFRKFAETINLRHDYQYAWNKAKLFKNKWTKTSPTSNASYNQSPDKHVEALSKIAPPWAPLDPDWLPSAEEVLHFEKPFTYSEYNIALSSRGDKSSPGTDGLNYEVLHNLPIKYHLLLLDILNLMYSYDTYPESWRDTYVHFVSKPNSNGYRPLALTSCIGKIFELMFSNRLRWWVETKNLLPRRQTGFRKGFSCADNLTIFKMDIEDSLKKHQQVAAVYLDVSNAFNEVQCHILLKKLATMGCSIKTLRYIKFLSYHRNIYTQANLNVPRACYKGVPQGGVLSPLLYLLYVSHIDANLHPKVKILQYADDIVIYVDIIDLDADKLILEEAVATVSNRLWKLGLEVSPGKTELVHFNKNGIAPGNLEVNVQGRSIVSTHSVKFLGIFFDFQLNYDQHLNHVHKKASKTLNILKFIRGVYWGADPTTLISFYKAFTRSVIDYGSFIYFPTHKNKILKLERIQYSAIRMALGLRISTPTNILLAESRLISLQNRAKILCNNFLLKLFTKTSTITYETLNKHIPMVILDPSKKKNLLRECIKKVVGLRHELHTDSLPGPYNYSYDSLTASLTVDIETGQLLKKSDYPNLLFQSIFAEQEAIRIFTDGSKSENGLSVGTSCISMDLEIIKTNSINPKASIFTAECLAISDAMDIALQHRQCVINVFSDSLSALIALGTPSNNDSLNCHLLEIREKYTKFHTNNNSSGKVTFFWIPAHVGITGNEFADAEAKRATERPPDISKIPFTDLKPFYKSLIHRDQISELKEQGLIKGRIYFQRLYDPSVKPWYAGLNLRREIVVLATRCRSNHIGLNESLHRINIIDSPACPCGNESQDINHILWQCSMYDSQRIKLVQELIKLRHYPPYDVTSFLRKPDVQVIIYIDSFIKKCEIKL